MTRWVVVGGGAAGSVVAARLSERPDHAVTLIEAGPDHGPAPVPGDVGPVLDAPARLADAMVVRRAGTAAEPYHQGAGLGGSSLVNGAVVIGDLDAERAGHDLPIEAPWSLGGVGRALLDTAPDAAPVGLVRREGRRVTAADAYLRPAMHRDNLTIVTGGVVERVAIDAGRAIGAIAADGIEYEADRVVLCAGAFRTPEILLRSGVDVAGVGEGLQDHAGVAISLGLEGDAVGADAPATTVTVERPGRQIVALNHVPGDPAIGVLLAGRLDVASMGRVSLPDPDGPPLIELGQLSVERDLDGLAAVIAEAFELLDDDAFRRIVSDVYVDDAGTPASSLGGDPVRIRGWASERLGGYHHASGSCRMGVACGTDGAVEGHEHLFVGDASLLPGVPARNPYLEVVRLAERLGARWRDDPVT
ncbi:MAG: GMC family oxidoreductase [Ilumatobacter sp.]|uniref:GMC family oxidoreductase N-terminal domain-containing protein n=1 Tax=Ilumatobacter sp. TaxID=1967498 RepID=UPI0026223BC0|nr:GMC family oxidoreductase [Ilumatobacter sp.]MDJ0769735.1 GMC family oxidoreductase [Ilumatobacter sp.]